MARPVTVTFNVSTDARVQVRPTSGGVQNGSGTSVQFTFNEDQFPLTYDVSATGFTPQNDQSLDLNSSAGDQVGSATLSIPAVTVTLVAIPPTTTTTSTTTTTTTTTTVAPAPGP